MLQQSKSLWEKYSDSLPCKCSHTPELPVYCITSYSSVFHWESCDRLTHSNILLFQTKHLEKHVSICFHFTIMHHFDRFH